MFTSCSDVSESGITNYAALALLSQSGGSGTGARIARGTVSIGGVSLEKTTEVYVLENTATINGSGSAGVFIGNRNVTLSPFIMGKYEVTQELYEKVMTNQKVTVSGTEYTLSATPSVFSDGSSIAAGETQNLRPVENVSWYDAVYFCNALSEKLGLTKAYTITVTTVDSDNHITAATVTPVAGVNGYRLPTEAEWEFAARGGDPNAAAWNYTYSGTSDDLGSFGWYSDNSDLKTHEAGKKNANSLGLYDMSGNVCEWCYDWSGSISTGTATDPTGASSGSIRVLRGGSWDLNANSASVSVRLDITSGYRGNLLGLRVVRSAL